MSFKCCICGEVFTEEDHSHGIVCIYCDTTLVDDVIRHIGKFISI